MALMRSQMRTLRGHRCGHVRVNGPLVSVSVPTWLTVEDINDPDGRCWSMGSPEAGNTRLRSARQALGLRSQQQLADAVTRAGNSIGLRISITARTVRRWE